MGLRDYIIFLGGIILSILSSLFGYYDTALKTLVLFVVIDYITGTLSALYNGHNLSSKRGLQGLIKKFLYFCIVAVAYQIDKLLVLDGTLRFMTIYGLIANDGLSILENAGEIGIPLPKLLIKSLEVIIEKGEENE